MRIFDKPVIMLTHNDLDGVGSPVVLQYIASLTEDIVKDIYYTNNGDVETTIDKIIEKNGTDGYKLLICDHSPLKWYYDKMIEKKIDFMIFDHHKSSEVQGLDNVVFDTKQCATMLFFNHIGKHSFYNELIDFVYHVNDYDMWIHESTHSKRLNELLYETSIFEFVDRFSAIAHPGFTDTEELIVSTAEKKRNRYIDRAERTVVLHTDHEKNRFGVVYAEQHQSQLGHELIDRLGIDYIFMVNVQGTKVSLRSAGLVDVAEVAKHFGTLMGSNFGGHKAASGFGFSMSDLPKLYYLLETY
jgi:oligoribonuclease NrnB/cAMP/cGMP phosphodiesterase (DHH superfamily)